MDQDIGVIQFHDHLFGIGDEVGGEVAAVKLHAFHDGDFGFQALGFFHRDHAFIADLLHGLGNFFTDEAVTIGRNRTNLSDFFCGLHFFGAALDVGNGCSNGEINTALQIHRVHARCDIFCTFAHDGLSQNGRGGGAVTGGVIGLGGHFAHHLGAHVLELVFQFDFLGNRHTVFGDAGGAEGLFDHNVTTLGAECDFHSIGKNVDATQHFFAGIGGKTDFFRSHFLSS